MKKISVLILVLLLSLTLVLSGCAGNQTTQAPPAEGEKKPVIELKLSHFNNPAAVSARQVEAWAKRVEERANGELKITIYPGGSLGAPADHYEMVKNGVVDIATSFLGITPGVFPVAEGIGLPMLGYESTVQASQALMDMYLNTDYMKKEFSEVQVMYLHTYDPALIGTNKKIETMEDLKGLKLRVTGGPITSFFTKLGASPVSMPVTEMYQSLEKGVLQGYVIDSTGVPSYKLDEHSTNILDAKCFVGPFFCLMNKAKWESLPDNIKAAFEAENGMTGAINAGKLWDQDKDKVYSELKIPVNTLSAEERARWEAVGKEVAQEWIKDMDAKGYPGQEIYDKYIELRDKYK